MKDVLIMTQLMDFAGGPEAGEWYEKGHPEAKLLGDRAVAGDYHVLLTREEWIKIVDELDELESRRQFEAEGS